MLWGVGELPRFEDTNSTLGVTLWLYLLFLSITLADELNEC